MKNLPEILRLHALWLKGDPAGKRANLRYANLRSANLSDADLRLANLSGANLSGADLRSANLRYANLRYANLSDANLSGANLSLADLRGANLRSANLSDADLSDANLRCTGNMRELRTMQFDGWAIAYTADILQIGCQTHTIDKWKKWNTPAGRKWLEAMDSNAIAWAERNLSLVLKIIERNPAQ